MNLIQRVVLGTPPQEVLAPLPHIHVIFSSLFVSSHRGYWYQIWAVEVHSALLH